MKTNFKSLFYAAAIMLVASTSVSAQSTGLGTTADVNVTARILKQIVLSPTDVSFGAVTAGNVADLNPIDPNLNQFISVRASAGRLLVDASGGEIIRVTYNDTLQLTHTNNTDKVGYQTRVAVVWGDVGLGDAGREDAVLLSNDDDWSPTTTVTKASGTGIGGLGFFSTKQGNPQIDKATMFIGGKLFDVSAGPAAIIPNGQTTGTYTGTLVFDLTYFGI